MDQVLRSVTSAYAYIDDVLIASLTPELQIKDLRTVFECLSAHGIIIKCVFGVPELDFIGHHTDSHGITPLSEKVQAIRDFPQPQSQCQLYLFIGLVNFLPHCAQLRQPHHFPLYTGKFRSQSLTKTDYAIAAFNDTKKHWPMPHSSLRAYPNLMHQLVS